MEFPIFLGEDQLSLGLRNGLFCFRADAPDSLGAGSSSHFVRRHRPHSIWGLFFSLPTFVYVKLCTIYCIPASSDYLSAYLLFELKSNLIQLNFKEAAGYIPSAVTKQYFIDHPSSNRFEGNISKSIKMELF